MKTILFPAIVVLVSLVLPASARLISFFPTELDFGSVVVGDTSWREVRFRYSGPDSGRVLIEIGSQRTFCFGNWQVAPEARCVYGTIGAIFNAVKMYRQDFGEDPPSVERLLELFYLEIPDSIATKWTFSLIGSPVAQIEAVSTAENPYGEGHTALFDITVGRFSGWGLNDGSFYLNHLGVNTIRIWFAPRQEWDYLDTLTIEAFGNHGSIERQLLPCSGNGRLAVEKEFGYSPNVFELHSPFPNPFNSMTTLSFSLSKPMEIRLDIFDTDGREIAFLNEGYFGAGDHNFVWKAGHTAPGVYYARMYSGNRQAMRKIILIR